MKCGQADPYIEYSYPLSFSYGNISAQSLQEFRTRLFILPIQRIQLQPNDRQALFTEGEKRMVMPATVCSGSSQKNKITHISQMRKCKYSIQEVCRRARSLARIKVSAFGAGGRGFKSHRARFIL